MDAQAVEMCKSRFGLECTPHGPMVPVDRIMDVAFVLKRELGFHWLTYITAAHYPAAEEKKKGDVVVTPADTEHFLVVYRVRNLQRKTEFAFRCRVEAGGDVPSMFPVWAGADWQERECFDLVGVRFRGHPDLRRIMMPEDWEGHPLQRTYAIDTPHRPWR